MKVHLSNSELASIGCKNCIWLLHGQCPHKLEEGSVFVPEESSSTKFEGINGMCPQYFDFIMSFAGEEDSVSALWEKFTLYIARLQSMDDYKSFMLERKEYEAQKDSLDPKERMQAEIRQNTLRIWWERLSDTVMKGYGKIADREGRSKEGARLPGIMNAKTINFNVGHDKKEELEDKSK